MVYKFNDGYTGVTVANGSIVSIVDGDFRSGGEIFNRYSTSQKKHIDLKLILDKYEKQINDELQDIFLSEIKLYKEHYDKNKEMVDLHSQINAFLTHVNYYNKCTTPSFKENVAEKAKFELSEFTKNNLK
jgi:hypothetical protein